MSQPSPAPVTATPTPATSSSPATSSAPAKAAPPSAFAPFGHRTFALIWTATLLSNIGTWMHDVSAAWLMTSLSTSPVVVSLVQAATTFAMALFALPAGAMADLFDRKKLLITLNGTKAVLATLLGFMTVAGLTEAWSLLLITFLMGICAAIASPVFQSIVPSLVPREVLKPAVALNSMGVNVARAIGPTLGGIIIVSAGVASAFFINAASELIIIAALLLWKPAPRAARSTPPEQFLPAMAAGLRFAAHAPALQAVLWRALGFFLFAAAFWALLPLIARQTFRGDAGFYGLMVGAVGFGAVAGALILPRLDRALGPDRLVKLGGLLTALVLVVLALAPWRELAVAACGLAGIGWIMVLSSLNVAAQNALPDWVRGRGLSIYGLAFFGAMTIGSLLWGSVASAFGITLALLAAATGMVLAIPLLAGKTLASAPADLSPSGHWPEPVVHAPVPGDRGPVMVTIDYRIDPANEAAFRASLTRLAQERRRDGAYQWGLMQDAADPTRFTEYFLVESWAEHERQHARVTKADADVQAEAQAYHLGPEPPVVRHLLGGARG